MAAALLEAEGLTKRYGGLVANNAVSMTMAAGEVRGLIGPNGAGKTTFVNLLTGLETPDAGRIRLGGADLTGLPPNRIAAQGLVRTFQVARVFANLSVRENLLVPFLAAGSPGGVREGLARAAELLAVATLRAAGRRAGRRPLGRPAHAAAGVRGLHDPGCAALRARRAVRRHQSGGQGHADRPDPAREHAATVAPS